MPKPLSPATIQIVKATVPALKEHGAKIVTEMYSRLFANAEIRQLFNQSHQGASSSQHKALTDAILAYASHIENPGVLTAAIERIANKHVGLQILPEHYPHVAEALLGAIKAVLGDVASDEILQAWGEAYWFLANILIAREEALYAANAKGEGGWTGWREFRIAGRHNESVDVISFQLEPVDGGAVLLHRPGQYLSFDFQIDGISVRRNYSISSAPDGKTYRITVKQVEDGIVSTWLHDHAMLGTVLLVAPPSGDFYLQPKDNAEIILLSGGVGLTPMLSMLESIDASSAPISFIHATLNGDHHVMAERVNRLADHVVTFYEAPSEEDRAKGGFHSEGRIDGKWLAQNTPVETADYYICGPEGFMAMAVKGLRKAGVPENRINYEFFGPAVDLSAA